MNHDFFKHQIAKKTMKIERLYFLGTHATLAWHEEEPGVIFILLNRQAMIERQAPAVADPSALFAVTMTPD